MQKQEFTILINTSPERVWEILWNDKYYRQWTAVFAEGSTAETDWNEGSKVLFHDGKGNGMVSFIAEKRPNEFMSFRHMGVVKDGVEDMEAPEAKKWAGATENYTLKDLNGKTELRVEMDITDEYRDYFMKTWPQAMDKIKELSEQKVTAPA